MPPEKIDQKKKQFLKQKIAEQTEKVKKCKSAKVNLKVALHFS